MAKKAKSENYEDAEEMKWQAECDARTIMEYQAIQKDDKRKSAAMKHIDEKLKLLKAAKQED